jgi:hypothetical protein
MLRLVLLGLFFVIPARAVAQPHTVVVVNPQPPAEERTPVVLPEYETIHDAYNKPVFTAGALVFLGSYGASVIAAAAAGDEDRERGLDRLYIPVAGPWLALGKRDDWGTSTKVLLVVDGVFQAGGMIGMIHGVLQPSKRRVVTQTSAVRVTPTVVGQSAGAGLALFGRF